MQIANTTPFPADIVLWEDLQGQAKLTIIVKTTFEIQNAKPVPRAKQLPIFTADQHYKDDPNALVQYETDRIPYKPLADVVLVGRAHAPRKQPVAQIDVSLRIGSLHKIIRVFGNRKWQRPTALANVPVISPPEPFTTMDLTYDRAYGGIDSGAAQYCPENPAGIGFMGKNSKGPIDGKPLPNLEDPNHLIRSYEDRLKPVGFGFYGRGWMPRLQYAGTYDEKYQKERAPAFPTDFSYALFNGAHPDMQVQGYLRGDEPVELVNLCSESRLKFALPGICPKIAVRKWTTPPEEWIERNFSEGREVTLDQVPTSQESVSANLDTLVFMPDDGSFYEVFRGICSLNNLEDLEVAEIRITL
jgi:hypothetical protein